MLYNLLFAIMMAILPACDTEDGNNCSWDASEQGNGQGSSFIVLDHKVWYEK